MLSCLPHEISSVTHFSSFLERSQQNGPPVTCSRSQVYRIFLYRFPLLFCFTPISCTSALKDYVPKEAIWAHVCLSQAFGTHTLTRAYITLLGILTLSFAKEESHKDRSVTLHLFFSSHTQTLKHVMVLSPCLPVINPHDVL